MDAMKISSEVQMLNALELFHYSYRFQNRLFVLSLSNDLDLADIVTDIRVLNAARIRCLVIVKQSENLPQTVENWNKRGYPFTWFAWESMEAVNNATVEALRDSTESGDIPVLGIGGNQQPAISQEEMDRFTIDLAAHFVVDKVFFLSRYNGLEIDNRFISHLTPQEAQQKLGEDSSVNIGKERLTCFVQSNLDLGFEIVLLKGENGSLFQEIFTHRGVGTLLTNDYPNVIRKGKLSDVMDITLLLKPYVLSGAILPVSEDAIAREVTDYYVYTVNRSIVAIAKLTDHGPATELAKFCTLPRYQGKGRARELAEKMIATVKQANKAYMFALSIEPKMFDFFKSLGFKECDRSTLPDSWKKNYDLNRSSKAFRLDV